MRRCAWLALLCGCATVGAPSGDREVIRRLMGSSERLKFEIQLLTVAPIDNAAIAARVAALARNIAKVPWMAGKRARAVAILDELAKETWTAESAADRFGRLQEACAACHASMPPRAIEDAPVALRSVTSLTSWDACGRCHQAVYDEWKRTLHAGAWLDPVYRMSAGNPPRLECRGCHSMEPILAGEIDTDYSWRPIFRDYNQEDAVGCAACHLRADGTVAARHDVDAPCRPRRDDRITRPEYCGACHNPSHDAYTEWKTTTYAKQGISCSDCHSFPVLRTTEGGAKRVGFSHSFPGGNDPAFVMRSIHAETKLEKGEIVMRVENRCGHKFPGEVPSRSFGVRIEGWDAQDEPLEPDEIWLKRPFKAQVGVPDTRLLPDEARVLRRPVPERAATLRVTYLFKQSPLMMERGWVKLAVWETKVAR